MSEQLKGRVYIVTGGSRGFGLAIARHLVELGARVGLTGRTQASLDTARAALGEEHCFTAVADAADAAATQRAFADIKQHFGRLDGLVNNAGLARPNKVESLVEAEVVLQVNTNFLGTVFSCQAAIPLLRDSDNPRIINISSASAYHFDEMGHLSIYASTKAAVERFTRDLAMELYDDEIGVSCIRPGHADTEFAVGWDMEATMAGFEAWRAFGSYTREGMTVDDIAGAVAYTLAQPRGVAVDMMEIRPNRRIPK